MGNIVNSHQSILFINDPNDVNINVNLPQAISQYQDMHIYAELTASRKGRSIIKIGEDIETDDKIVVNFLGVNQNIDSPNYLNFTSNYYDGSTVSTDIQYESFGISNIKVLINSSYVPQVSIEFVDVRGLSFFNQEKSPYRILFDFPPPIFKLKIKGYYGRTLEYELHLVKYNTEFKSENGNFVINADFIAVTFAPLTDILLRYITNVPLIGKTIDEIKSDPKERPKNTFDFILKLKALYSAGKELLKNSKEVGELKTNTDDIELINSTIDMLGDYNNALSSEGTPILLLGDVSASGTYTLNGVTAWNGVAFTKLSAVVEYDETIKGLTSNQDASTVNKRLFVGYLYNEVQFNVQKNLLNDYAKKLNDNMGTLKITGADTSNSVMEYGYYVGDSTSTAYLALDVTNAYIGLYRKKNELQASSVVLGEAVNTLINSAIEDNLGMLPTVYQVFKIILDDVDAFFKILKEYSIKADAHHNNPTNKQLILDVIKDTKPSDNYKRLYPFPLIIDTQTVNCLQQQVRVSPKKISEKLTEPFPELKLVYEFMDTFAKQATLEINGSMREQTNSDGTYKWIPITPLDSLFGGAGAESPYYGLGFSDETELDKGLNVIINRFYILTQFSLYNGFYLNDERGRNLRDLYAKSEASNIVLSISNLKSLNLLKNKAITWRNDSVGFYTYLGANNIPQYKKISNNYITSGGIDIYNYKLSTEYIGVTINRDIPTIQEIPDDATNPLAIFIKETQGFWKDFFTPSKIHINFTKDNNIHIRDGEYDVDDTTGTATLINADLIAGTANNTRFITNWSRVGVANSEKVDDLKKNGNRLLNYTNLEDKFNNAIDDVWCSNLKKSLVTQLEKNGTNDVLVNATIILSNFGYALSPFNNFPNDLNDGIFLYPAVVEVPYFLPAYVGAIIIATETGVIDDIINNDSIGVNRFIAADSFDFINYIGNEDKTKFRNEYNDFIGSAAFNSGRGYTSIKNSIIEIIKEVNNDNATDKYKELLKGRYFGDIIQPLFKRISLVVNSDDTFAAKSMNSPIGYITLYDKNSGGGTDRTNNDMFFKAFWGEVYNQLKDHFEDIKNKEISIKNLKGDDDITTQLYYSFKNINDKWLTNPNETRTGYPYNTISDHLIDTFAFVDRAMNPIGDTIINPEILITLFEDPNVSVYSVLSQLLSLNHFEFFPLQNFMTHNQTSWEDTFAIDPVGNVIKKEAFVCMYIGGSSSYPSNISGNGFENDGITDITTTDASDFNDCTGSGNDAAVAKNNSMNFDYKQVRAFRVKFGQQNQSMFTDIKIDSKEYPETNESIQILARLANDQGVNAPTPKGQNLYNMYENRAYSATVTGLGNAMIQPTQYFQLDNIPMFNGAYIILSVEHNIHANSMTTSFTGTKILRYPIPRVTNPAAAIDFDGGVGGFMASPTLGKEAQTMSNARLKQLKSVFGIDISHHNGKIDWNKINVKISQEDPEVKFVLMKVSQGTNVPVQPIVKTYAADAKVAGLKIGYYHFNEPFTGTDEETKTNAKAQAKYFVSQVKTMPEPNFPLVLDFEKNDISQNTWGNDKNKNDLWLSTFFTEVKTLGYNSIAYGGNLFDEKTNGKTGPTIPLWLASYPYTPETTNPKIPKGWNDWTIWQFSSQGKVNGVYSNGLDINAMKKSFFDKY